MLTAVSSGVRAPEVQADRARRAAPARRRSARPPRAGPSGPRGYAASPSRRRRRRVGQPQRDLEQRHVELRVVGEHAEHGALVDPAGLDLLAEVLVRPLDDHLVGRRGSASSWRRPAARRRRSPCSRGSCPSGRRRPRSRWHRRPASAAAARRTTRTPACPRRGARRPGRTAGSVVARGEQPERVVGDRGVGPGGAERTRDRPARRLPGPDDEPPADPGRVRVLDDGRHRDRAAGLDVVGDSSRARGRCAGRPSRRRRRGSRRRSARPRTRRRR